MYVIEHRINKNDWAKRSPVRKKNKTVNTDWGYETTALPGDLTFRNLGRGSNVPRLVHFVSWQRQWHCNVCLCPSPHPSLHCIGALRAAWGGEQQNVVSECREWVLCVRPCWLAYAKVFQVPEVPLLNSLCLVGSGTLSLKWEWPSS